MTYRFNFLDTKFTFGKYQSHTIKYVIDTDKKIKYKKLEFAPKYVDGFVELSCYEKVAYHHGKWYKSISYKK